MFSAIAENFFSAIKEPATHIYFSRNIFEISYFFIFVTEKWNSNCTFKSQLYHRGLVAHEINMFCNIGSMYLCTTTSIYLQWRNNFYVLYVGNRYVCTIEKMKDVIIKIRKRKIEKHLSQANTFNFFKMLGNTDIRNSTNSVQIFCVGDYT